jgi:Cu/Ag efflux protein CusF
MRTIPLLMAALSAATLARGPAIGRGADGAATPAASASAPMTDGEVRKVGKDTQTLTLRHGEIANLGMPGMTMVFKVKDPAVLDKLQVGDKVRFTADRVNGSLTVTAIEVAR